MGTTSENSHASYVIFFCTFDPFGRGLRRYTYRMMCEEDCCKEPWNGSKHVFLNAVGTAGEVNPELEGVLSCLAGDNEDKDSLVRVSRTLSAGPSLLPEGGATTCITS